MKLFDVYPLFDIAIARGKGCHPRTWNLSQTNQTHTWEKKSYWSTYLELHHHHKSIWRVFVKHGQPRVAPPLSPADGRNTAYSATSWNSWHCSDSPCGKTIKPMSFAPVADICFNLHSPTASEVKSYPCFGTAGPTHGTRLNATSVFSNVEYVSSQLQM